MRARQNSCHFDLFKRGSEHKRRVCVRKLSYMTRCCCITSSLLRVSTGNRVVRTPKGASNVGTSCEDAQARIRTERRAVEICAIPSAAQRSDSRRTETAGRKESYRLGADISAAEPRGGPDAQPRSMRGSSPRNRVFDSQPIWGAHFRKTYSYEESVGRGISELY